MDKDDMPKENDFVIESVFIFDSKIYAALTDDQKLNCLMTCYDILNTELQMLVLGSSKNNTET